MHAGLPHLISLPNRLAVLARLQANVARSPVWEGGVNYATDLCLALQASRGKRQKRERRKGEKGEGGEGEE